VVGPVVELPGPGRPRGIGVGGFLLALVTAGALVHVAVRLRGIEVAYALGKERRINTELEEQRRRLHIEIGMLKDPVRVVELARDQLKMGPPDPGDIVRLGGGGTLPFGRAADRSAETATATSAARSHAARAPAAKVVAKPPVAKPAAPTPSAPSAKPPKEKPGAAAIGAPGEEAEPE